MGNASLRKVKQIALAVLNRIAASLPPRLGMRVRNLWFFGQPVLDYLEFHAADHCNMNCAGCTHYSPFLRERCADVDVVRRDFARLKELFRNIRKIRIMGGEPLLNPELTSLMRIVREAFPKCHVTVATNGLLLSRQGDAFWEACRTWRVGIDFTVYQPMKSRVAEVEALCRRHQVPLRVTTSGLFLAKIDPHGRQPMRQAFRSCRRETFCPFLLDGRIYPCAESCLPDGFNAVAGTRIRPAKGLALVEHTGSEILEYLMCPVFACCHCSYPRRTFEWHNSDIRKEDWFA